MRRRLSPDRRLGAAVPVVALLALFPGCGENRRAASPGRSAREAGFLVGRWSGDLRQAGLRPFRVEADIRSLGPDARNPVSYTGIDCRGHWAYLGVREVDYRFREVIDRGRGGTCKGVGEVSLRRLEGGRLGYAFRGGGVQSRGVLQRRP